ncbi:reverse transcriptase [Gossypium australe]|uniref:Reverse transcriptase n=1 Tax=Gossypium australe TaxID=47621 RepID=A0A5B6W6Z2_9ROSI|nr:reverse transcriptase [Gossypium australe]
MIRGQNQMVMDQDLEVEVVLEEEGKKRARGDFEDSNNIEGLGNPRAVRRLQHSLKLYSPQVVFLMETKINKFKMEKVRKSCGYQYGYYGSPYINDREESWNLLRRLHRQGEYPWLEIGLLGKEAIYRKEIFKKGLTEELLRKSDLLNKLQIMKGGLERWANQIRRNEKIKKEVLNSRLAMLLGAERNDENLAKIIDTKIHLNLEIDKDESYWEQRARINWLKLGNRNTSFFHKQATQRSKRNFIHRLQFEDGRETKESKEMEEIARLYFMKLFSAGRQYNNDRILSGIEMCVSDEDNFKLKARYTKEEIWKALSEMGPTKAPEEDGLPAIFYQKCWPIIGEDVSNYCLQKLNDGLVAVKLYMSKAYDRVDWNFVERVMKKMGSDTGWVDMVIKCVSTVSYSVVFNGSASESFIPSRGLRQGDPLSPFLFLCCGEGLSSLMRLAKIENILKGVKASRRGPAISHLLFADDCILFAEAT